MAGISFDFRNIMSPKKCDVPSPRIVNLEIGDESPGIASESVFQRIFLNHEVCHNDMKNSNNSNCGCDKQSDKNFLIHSQSSLSTSTCVDRPSDKIKSTNDSGIDPDFLDLLKSVDLPRAVESGAGNCNSKKTAFDDKMKIISNTEVCDGSSNLLSSITEKAEGSSTLKYFQTKSAEDSRIDLLDFKFNKNDDAHCLSFNNSSLKAEGNLSDLLSSINVEDSDVTKDCLSYNNSSLKAEDNLSDLLSSIDIEDSNITKVGSFNSRNMCNTKLGTKSKIESETLVTNLSDLLSSIDLGDSNDKKVQSFNSRNMCNTKVANKSKIESETPVTDLSDLLCSIDLGDSNDNKVGSFKSGCTEISEAKNESYLADLLSSIDIDKSNKQDSTILSSKQSNLHNMKGLEANNESCLADLLSSIDIDKSNKPTLAVLSSKPLSSGTSNMDFNDNCISGSLNDLLFDIESSTSSSNSCSSSYSEKGSNSPEDSSTKNNLLTDKIFESDSGYNSFDSVPKGFSFFNYSSDNQFSFNKLLIEKSHASIDVKRTDSDDAENANEEMSMSDLMTIVSPEFKNPVLASLNKVEKHEGSISKDSSGIQDLIESLNINVSCVTNNIIVDSNEKPMNYDCVDGRISKNVHTEMETIDILGDSGKEDVSTCKSDFDDDDDEQITFIDLRECIKSTEHHFTPSSPMKQDKSVENETSECFSPNKILFYCEDKSPSDSSQHKPNPFEFQNVSPRKRSKVNTKQTLFSKALACKPKKDHSLLQSVTNIKNELLNNIIHRPIFVDCDVPQPIVESVIQADRCIFSKFQGRKYFGIDPPCELQ